MTADFYNRIALMYKHLRFETPDPYIGSENETSDTCKPRFCGSNGNGLMSGAARKNVLACAISIDVLENDHPTGQSKSIQSHIYKAMSIAGHGLIY